MNAVGEEEGASARVVKLTPVVALHSFYRDTKLCTHIREKVCQCGKGVRFNTQRKSPQAMRTVIENN